MSTISDVVAEMMDSMGLPADRRDDVADAVRASIEGTYDDSCRASIERDDTGELAARREKLDRAVWSALDLGAYPW